MISFSIKAALPPAAVPWQRRCFRRRWPGSTERASSLWSSRCAPQAAVAADQVVGGTIVAELGGGLALQLRDNALRQYLAQFDAPLIEGIDIPRSEEHTSELQSHLNLLWRLLLEKKKTRYAL